MRASEPGVGRWGPNSNSKPEVATACSRPWPLAHAHVHVRARVHGRAPCGLLLRPGQRGALCAGPPRLQPRVPTLGRHDLSRFSA